MRNTPFAAMLLITLCTGMGGCTSLFSGSLRVEVDVYKGPLTKEFDGQKAELAALMAGIPSLLDSIDHQIARTQCYKGCLAVASGDPIHTPTEAQCLAARMPQKCTAGKAECKDRTPWSRNDLHARIPRDCHELQGLRGRVAALKHETLRMVGPPTGQPPMYDNLRKFAASQKGTMEEALPLQRALGLAAQFRAAAAEVSFQWAAAVRNSKSVRIDQVKFANAMAEISNHLGSRADSLLKQGVGETDKRALSTGQYLRDSAVTRYSQTYRWLDAAVAKEDVSVEHRTRIVEQLFDDGTWARVNEVYASGTGKVSMAFIKDDIGNWDLKAFENDPTEMIESFRAVGKASLKAAVDLASKGGAGTVVNKLTDANAAYFGEAEAPAAVLPPGLTFEEQHKQFRAELDAIDADYKNSNSADLEVRNAALQRVNRLVEKHAYLIKALQQALIFEADSQKNDETPMTTE